MAKSERFKKLEYSDSELLDRAVRISFDEDKGEAADHGLKFDLTQKDYRRLIFSNCFFCRVPGSTPITTKKKKIGIDRIDLTLPHSRKNTVPCCHFCFKVRRKVNPQMVFRILLIHARLGKLDEKSKTHKS